MRSFVRSKASPVICRNTNARTHDTVDLSQLLITDLNCEDYRIIHMSITARLLQVAYWRL